MDDRGKSDVFSGFVFLISKAIAMVAFIGLVFMMVFTVTDVLMRALFNRPIAGSVELIEFLMVIVGFLVLAWCGMQNRHIKVELLVSLFPKGVRGILKKFNYAACFIIFSIMAWRVFLEARANADLKTVSPELGIPIFPFYWVVAVGYAVLCLVLLVQFIGSFKGKS
jgi:TRAP-type C4-dicarboxylate transport system permease small subunit